MKKFIDLLNNQFDEPIELTEDTILSDLDNWDSLTSFMIIDVIKEEYNVVFTENDLKTLTIKQLFGKI